jgi:hypothetical protein
LKEGSVYWIGIDGSIVVEKGGILDILRLTYGYKQLIQIPVAEVEKKRIFVSLPAFSSC